MQVGTNSLPTQPHPSRTSTKDRPHPHLSQTWVDDGGGKESAFTTQGGIASGLVAPQLVLPHWETCFCGAPTILGFRRESMFSPAQGMRNPAIVPQGDSPSWLGVPLDLRRLNGAA